MNIGDRVKVILGTQLRKEFANIPQENLWGYRFLGREGVIVKIDRWGYHAHYHVHLDGDMRPDGSPDVRVFEADSETCISQTLELVAEAAMSETDATALNDQKNESVNRDVRQHNDAITAEIKAIEPEIERNKAIYAGAKPGQYSDEQQDAIRANGSLYARLGTLKNRVMSEAR